MYNEQLIGCWMWAVHNVWNKIQQIQYSQTATLTMFARWRHANRFIIIITNHWNLDHGVLTVWVRSGVICCVLLICLFAGSYELETTKLIDRGTDRANMQFLPSRFPSNLLSPLSVLIFHPSCTFRFNRISHPPACPHASPSLPFSSILNSEHCLHYTCYPLNVTCLWFGRYDLPTDCRVSS